MCSTCVKARTPISLLMNILDRGGQLYLLSEETRSRTLAKNMFFFLDGPGQVRDNCLWSSSLSSMNSTLLSFLSKMNIKSVNVSPIRLPFLSITDHLLDGILVAIIHKFLYFSLISVVFL